MRYWKRCVLAALMLLGAAGFSSGVLAQDSLEELVETSREEEEELDQTPGTEIYGPEDEPLTGRIRLPKGEEPERLRISQDRVIDPDAYIVGPGDVLQLYIWGEFDLSYSLQVDPEGHVLIPTIGDFAISDLTLSNARKRIFAAAQEQYEGMDITLNLSSMRFFTVYITGGVVHEGGVSVHPNTRLSELIETSGGFLDELRGGTVEETQGGKTVTRVRQLTNSATARRTILVTHSDATADTVDLPMFLATGDLNFNPYLRMGDQIHVNFRRHEVSLYGPFIREGTLEFRQGDTIGNLVALAGGRRNEDPIEYAEVWRFAPGSEDREVIPLAGDPEPGKRVTLADIADFPVQPKDMVFIRTLSYWQYSPTVQIHGAIRYRGRYRIIPGETRLRDVVDMAGGFTENASLLQATVISTKYRRTLDPELKRLRDLERVGGRVDMTPEDKAYLKTKGRERRGQVVVDFTRLFEQGDETQNALLEGGDIIYIPEKRLTVTVSGQVKNPGLIEYEEGKGIKHYLQLTGGYTWRADRDACRLIRARTNIRLQFDDDLIVEEGDEIWIPEVPYRDWWAFTQSTVQTVAQALTLIVLVRAF